MKKNVVQVIPYLGIGGAEKIVESLSVELSKKDYNVTVVSLYSYKSHLSESLESQNIHVEYFDKISGIDIKLIFNLYKYFKKIEPHIVHTHLTSMPYAMLAATLARIPMKIHTVHSMADKEVGKFMRYIYRFIFRFYDVVPVAISPIVHQSLVDVYNLKQRNIPIVFNGINLKNLDYLRDYHIEKNAKILHIGNFKKAKNHEKLIQSFKMCLDKGNDVELFLIGEGELKTKMIELVNNLEIANKVNFLGAIDNASEVLNKYDIFVLPSAWEGMPITIIEAMSTGMPILATKVGGIPDILEHKKTGYLVNNDIIEICEGMEVLLKKRSLRERIGKNAYLSSKKFSSKNMSLGYIEIYNKGNKK